MIYGYARVSSTEQNLDRQVLALQEYVKPENIVMDRQSGKNLDRPGYNALKGIFGLRPGDVLYIVNGRQELSQPGQHRRNLECPVRVSTVW